MWHDTPTEKFGLRLELVALYASGPGGEQLTARPGKSAPSRRRSELKMSTNFGEARVH
jgi:hypothetical protein